MSTKLSEKLAVYVTFEMISWLDRQCTILGLCRSDIIRLLIRDRMGEDVGLAVLRAPTRPALPKPGED